MSSQNKFLKIVVEVSRLIVGATFAFSGFVKAVDPLGFTYKIQDYLIKLNLTELFSLALPVAIIMAVAEFMLGVLLLLGIYRKWTTIFIGVFMAFFTPLTLWIAIANPVADCGCFGDALIISNWQTFYKNIFLSVFTIILIIYWRKITSLFSSQKAMWTAGYVAVFGLLFALHNVYKLPVLDFRPYKIGNNIPEQMYVDPAKADVFENVFVYSKNGEEKEFTEENYPWDDSTWVFVDMKTKLVKEGEKPKIEDFALESLFEEDSLDVLVSGEDITESLLSNPEYSFLMISYSLQEMNKKHLNRFEKVSDFASQKNIPFYCVTSSSPEVVSDFKKEHLSNANYAHADERVLKTMIRANPGLILLKNGTVINKWDDSQVPDFASKSVQDLSKAEGLKTNFYGKLSVIFLILIVPLTIIKLTDKK